MSILSLLALPPYNTLSLGQIDLINLNTSIISSLVGITPVPIDHIGSYAIIISLLTSSRIESSFINTSLYVLLSLSNLDSPIHKIGVISFSINLTIFSFISSFVSF